MNTFLSRLAALAGMLFTCAALAAAPAPSAPAAPPAKAPAKAAPAAKAVQRVPDTAPALFVHIRMQPDGSFRVTERYKNFPRRFKRRLGRVHATHAPFKDSHPVETIEVQAYGKKLYAIDKTQSIDDYYEIKQPKAPEGKLPVVDVIYTTRHAVLFEDGRDVFAWDLLGPLQLDFPVFLTGAIQLPGGAKPLALSARHSRYLPDSPKPAAQLSKDGAAALFSSIKPLPPGGDLVMRVEIPKGVIADDGTRTLYWAGVGAFAACLLIVLAVCYFFWLRWGKDPDPGAAAVVVPRFHPPKLPDGRLMSPAACDYIKNSLWLTSKGFMGAVSNLVLQKRIAIKGTGAKGDPWRAERVSIGADERDIAPDLKNAVRKEEDAAASSNVLTAVQWKKRIAQGRGFDMGERKLLLSIPGALPFKNAASARWQLGRSMVACLDGLESELGDAWDLRTRIALNMHLAVYGIIAATLLAVWWMVGTGWAAGCASMSFGAFFTWIVYRFMRGLRRNFLLYREAGWLTAAALVAVSAGVPLAIFAELARINNPANIPEGWGEPAVMALWTLIPVAFAYLCAVTRSPLAILGSVIRWCGLALGLGFAYGLFWAMKMPLLVGTLMLAACLVPTAFLPLMKQPKPWTQQALADIAGFELYIREAETERLAAMDDGRTPETFERVMPYAIALGLEKAWGKRFADAAAAMNRAEAGGLAAMAQLSSRGL